MHRVQQIRAKLGGTRDMTQPFPERPKGMHEVTYIKLWIKSRQHEAQSNRDIHAYFDRRISKRQLKQQRNSASTPVGHPASLAVVAKKT